MSDISEFVKHLGPRVAHVTAASNLAGIQRYGLLSAHALAKATGHTRITLRDKRLRLVSQDHDAMLNHQRPILHGLAAANAIVDGYDAAGWAAQLDTRIFFWPDRRGFAFANSIKRDIPIAVIWLDTERLFSTFGDSLFASPINSGNFVQGGAHARRGDWIYTPVSEGFAAFRHARLERGLVKSTDIVKELSLTEAISPTVLTSLTVQIQTA